MKIKRNTRLIVSKILLIPITFTIITTVIISIILHNFVSKGFYNVYLNNTKSYSKTHVEQIVSNKTLEKMIIDELNVRLLNAMNFVLDQNINDLSDELLKEVVHTFDVDELFWFKINNNNAEQVFDSSSGEKRLDVKEGDPIHNFMISDKEDYFEGIRESIIEKDKYYMIAYKKNQDRTHFVEVSIDADYIYERTGDFRYEKTLKKLAEDNEQVISAFILDTDFNYIESIFREESIGVSEETIKIYRKVFAGETYVREKYSSTNNKKVLEILSPIEIDGEIKELISIYYTIDFYNNINTRTIIAMLSLYIIIILAFTSFIIIFLVKPLTYLENSLLSFNVDFGTYKRPIMNYYVFKDAYKALDNLSMHIQNSNLEKTELNNSIYELALTDYLTKLPNRLGLVQTINKYIEDDVKFALIFIDLDNFKTFNDTKGHAYGDRILVKVSTILNKYTHERLYIGRYGGDEFIILFKYEKRKHIQQILKHLYDKFKTPIILDHERNYVDLSGGVSLFPEDGNDEVELIRKADLAMYDSKLKGKNTYIYYNKNMDKYLEQEIKIKHEIEKSLSNDGIKIVLQPQVDVETNEIISYEALARLTSNKYGPGEFIQVAEKHNLIDELGIIVIDSVIKVLTSFKDHNLKLKTIYVNFSINQVKNEELINYILTELKKYDLHPKYFGIEITENILILDEEFSEAYFKELISQGFKIAIDDFGSGNASINYLVKYPLSLVKLDRSFVNKYLNQDSVVIFDTVVKLAKELNYQVLAEGVETIEQVELLKKSKCKYAQGYYFYKPLEVSEIIKLANNTLNK